MLEYITITREHIELLEALKPTLTNINENITRLVQVSQEQKSDNKALVDLVAGKKHVPLVVFFVVSGVLTALVVLILVDKSNMNVTLNWREGLLVSHSVEGQ